MEKRHAPVLRLKGFTDDWEQRKLGSIVCDYSEKNPVDEDLPILTSSRQGIQKQEEHFGSEQRHDTIDYNVIPRGYCTYRNRSDDRTFTFNVNDCIERGIVSKFYPVFSIDNGNAKFVTEYLNNNFEIKNKLAVLSVGTSQVVLSLNNLKSLDIQIPSKDEQEKIGGYLNSFDNLITLHQRKLEKLQNIKKAMLEKMFPKNEEKTPKIRFSGFTSDWEQRKLSAVVKEVKRTDETSMAPVMMITAENGFINQSERYSTNNAGQSLKKYILLEKGELAYNHGASKLRPFGSCFALTTEEEARIPFVYHCFFSDSENAEFLSIELNGKAIEKQLRRIVSSGARMDGLLNISFGEYTSIPILLPRKDEQDKIAGYFSNIDHLITLHQRKLEKLQNIKKAMLEKMFV